MSKTHPIDQGQVKFENISDKNDSNSKQNSYFHHNDNSNDDDEKNNPASKLKRMVQSIVPKLNQWLELSDILKRAAAGTGAGAGKPVVVTAAATGVARGQEDNLLKGLRLYISDDFEKSRQGGGRGGGGGAPQRGNEEQQPVFRERIFEFHAPNPNGARRIDFFCEKAMAWYISTIEQEGDNSRYLFMMMNPDNNDSEGGGRGGRGGGGFGGGGGGPKTNIYKRFALSDEKSFDNLFFPNKQSLLDLLQDFEAGTGIYARPGYPRKFGILLHGPPGTGKTTLIKALAAKTKRHVVSIELAKIETNQQLMDIMFDQVYTVSGLDFKMKLKHSEVIYMFEDIDEATPIVFQRPTKVEDKALREKAEAMMDLGELKKAREQALKIMEGDGSGQDKKEVDELAMTLVTSK